MTDPLDELADELRADPAQWSRAAAMRLLAVGSGGHPVGRERNAVLKEMFAAAGRDERRLVERLEFLLDTLAALTAVCLERAAAVEHVDVDELLREADEALAAIHARNAFEADGS